MHHLKSRSHADVHAEVLDKLGVRIPDLAALIRFNLTLHMHTHSVTPERLMDEIQRSKNASQHNLSLHTLNSQLLMRFNDATANGNELRTNCTLRLGEQVRAQEFTTSGRV